MIKNDIRQREQYHLYPEFGLLNDPNGLIFFKGQYHVFYQWNPKGNNHQYKVWGHFVSTDLQNWERLPIALEPDLPEDQSGIYSGTAIVVEDKLYVFYTGNVRNAEGESIASHQMWAVSEDGITFQKLGKIFDQPEGYTRHVRDPKIFQYGDNFYLLLGAQRKKDLIGDIIIYQSPNLQDWTFSGSLLGDELLEVRGYMIECPDIVWLDGQAVLIFSPQGLAAKGHTLQNIHNTGYVVGEFDENQQQFKPQTRFIELDNGFEFYAAQTLQHQQDTLLLGWAGMMPSEREKHLPTIAQDNWAHVLSTPRRLSLVNQELRQNFLWSSESVDVKTISTLPVGVWRISQQEQDWQLEFGNDLVITRQHDKLAVTRHQWESDVIESRIIQGSLNDIEILVDHSVLEIIVGNGRWAMTMRYF